MAFNAYSEIMYKGRYYHPIRITFKNGEKKEKLENPYKMILTGEGGNSHLILCNAGGSIDLWVDTHCASGSAFIHSIRIVNEPGARFTKYVYEELNKHMTPSASMTWFHFSIAHLDKFFEEIYNDMKNNRISLW